MTEAKNFLYEIIEGDLAAGRETHVVTRFPPEPNGYLHIGHAKSICLNFGIARDFKGVCHLRMDDTNPAKEDEEYALSIQRDVKWLGFDWADKMFYASDYYERLYGYAELLIKKGKAYVCSLSEEEFRVVRGTAFEPGKESPYRSRSVEESLDLLKRMRAGEFADGAHVVRAKIDMANPNMKMRDWPLMRIRHEHHYRTGDAWCLYPLYDFAHCLSDYIEGITHSICTLEFENNRELYDWIIDAVTDGAPRGKRPYQYEFARLNLTYTMMSKRKLLELVERKIVAGWDDPRMPTIAGLRRRGVTPEAIRDLCDKVGVAKNNSVVDVALFDHVVRDDLDKRAPRVMAVLRPLAVEIESWPEGHVEDIDAPYWPVDGREPKSRIVPMTRTLLIERDDFMMDPPKDFYRLAPGREVRLRHGYVIKCERVVTDPASGEVEKIICSHDPNSKGNTARKVKGTIHWVSADKAARAEVRLYDKLFLVETPGSAESLDEELNPDSLITVSAYVEPSLLSAKPGGHVQFERLGFFFADPVDSRDGAPVWNRTAPLKDSWAKKAAPAPEAKSEKAEVKKEPKNEPKKEAKAPSAEAVVEGEQKPKEKKAKEPKPEAPPLTSEEAAALDGEIDKLMAENADAVERYRAGNKNVLGAFVGMVMKRPGVKANPKQVSDALVKKLG